jgi:hypothetical protein
VQPQTLNTAVGTLSRLSATADGVVFWSGDHRDFDLWFCCPDHPSQDQLSLALRVLADLDLHLRTAREFLARAVVEDPSSFGVEAATAMSILEQNELPFDLPELLFRSGREWEVRFRDGALLPAFDGPFGVAVQFRDGTPTGASDLSTAEWVTTPR